MKICSPGQEAIVEDRKAVDHQFDTVILRTVIHKMIRRRQTSKTKQHFFFDGTKTWIYMHLELLRVHHETKKNQSSDPKGTLHFQSLNCRIDSF
jgi:hypothetical protein